MKQSTPLQMVLRVAIYCFALLLIAFGVSAFMVGSYLLGKQALEEAGE